MNRARAASNTPAPGQARPGVSDRARTLLLLLLLLLLPPLAGAGPRILVVTGGDSDVYRQMLDSVRAGIDGFCPDVATPDCAPRLIEKGLDDGILERLGQEGERWSLIVTVGIEAARALQAREIRVPVLNTLIPRSAAAELGLSPVGEEGSRSAVFIDQPLRRQLQLIPLIRPERHRLGVLLGPTTRDSAAAVRLDGRELGLQVQVREVDDGDKVGQAVRRILSRSDVLLALPDPLVYNRWTIVNIMLSSYHSRVPVIGFSAAYVRSGAVAAVYSTPEDVGRHVSDLIRRFLADPRRRLPAPQYPRYFHVRINTQVAHSLGIELPSADDVQRRLEALEGP